MRNIAPATTRSSRRSFTLTRWWCALAGTAVIAAALDALGKVWATTAETAWEGRIDPSVNDAYALGSIRGNSLILANISLLVLVVVTWWTARHWTWFHPWAIGLLVGGGASNGVDRLLNGAVTDFLVVGPILINLADLTIVVGLVVLAVDAAREVRREIAVKRTAARDESI